MGGSFLWEGACSRLFGRQQAASYRGYLVGGSSLWEGACSRLLLWEGACSRLLLWEGASCGRELAPDSLPALHRPKPCRTNDGYPLINTQIQQVPIYSDQQFCRAR